MAFFLENLSTLLFIILVLIGIGLGPVLWITPKKSTGLELLFSPVVAMVLIGSLGLLRISILVVRLRPAVDGIFLSLISAALCIFLRKKLLEKIHSLIKNFKSALVIPFLFLLLFSSLFSREGFLLLSAGEDELQYAANADQMIHHLHTGSNMDLLAPRIDHWVYDMATRDLPYNHVYRKGAEITLATFSVWLGRGPLEVFPIAVGTCIFLLLLILAFIGRDCLRLGAFRSLGLQASFMGSFHFFILHLQGSLANLCSCPMILGCISLFGLGLSNTTWRWFILSGILFAGVFTFYSEIALIGVVFPILFILILALIHEPQRLKERLIGLTVLAATTLLIANKSIWGVIASAQGNLQVVFANFGNSTANAVPLVKRLAHLRVSNWGPIAPLLGIFSYYDQSAANSTIAQTVSASNATFWIAAILFILTLTGFIKHSFYKSKPTSRNYSAQAFGFMFLAFISLTAISLTNEDYFRFMRCMGYSIPFFFIGLLLLGTSETYVKKLDNTKLLQFVGLFTFAALTAMNFWTTARSSSFVYAHAAADDPIIRRINPRAPGWTALREELRPSLNTPILISGFDNTPVPHLIISGIQPYPTFLGETITRFWHVMNIGKTTADHAYFNPPAPPDPQNERMLRLAYASVWPASELVKNWIYRAPNWGNILPDFIANSRQAIVPPGALFPPEWSQWLDIFPAKRTEFKNICDVVYKYEKAVELESNAIGALQKDGLGIYRKLIRATRLKVHDWRSDCFRLKVVYDGGPENLIIRKPDGSELTSKNRSNRLSESSGLISYSEALNVTLTPRNSSVVLREVDWRPSHCN